jgi:hypothetical protein
MEDGTMTRWKSMVLVTSLALLGAGMVPEAVRLSSSEALAHGIPAGACRANLGYAPQGPRLCMTGLRPAANFPDAMRACMRLFGRVADYHDWYYRDGFGDGISAPVGVWLGPLTGDNLALFANQPVPTDFDGEGSRFDLRRYACAHDRG